MLIFKREISGSFRFLLIGLSLFFIFISINSLFAQERLTSAGYADVPHETGVTITQTVLFSKETIADIEKNKPLRPETGRIQRVIPFGKIPQSAELPESDIHRYKPPELVPNRTVPLPLAPSLTGSFTGLVDDNTAIPPDTMGAVGPSHLLEILNTDVGIFNKSTGAIISQVSLQSFWSSLGTGAGQPANSPFDPKVIYDQPSSVFIVLTLGGGTSPDSWLMIAASATSDPTGVINKYAIDADLDGGVQTNNNWADFPCIGVDATNVYVTANMFSSSNVFQYSKVWVIPKAQLLSGSGTITWTEFTNPSGTKSTIQPVHVFGSSLTEYFIHQGYDNGATPPIRLVRISSVTFPGGTPTWSDLGYIQVNSYPTGTLPDAPQSGSAHLIATNDTRLCNAVFRNGRIWTTHTVADSTNTKTEVAWYQINPANAHPSSPGVPDKQGRIHDTNRWYYYPSIAVNLNDAVGIAFSGSSSTEFVSAYYTARIAVDGDGVMDSVGLLKGGLDSYFKEFGSGSNRWGDYSATCIDPSDDTSFWTLQEYASTAVGSGADSGRWGTWWGSFNPPTTTLIALAEFRAVLSEEGISIEWATATEKDNAGFNIWRSESKDSGYIKINSQLISGNGDSVSGSDYSFTDEEIEQGRLYYYKLEDVDIFGKSTMHEPVLAEVVAFTTLYPDSGKAGLQVTISGAGFGDYNAGISKVYFGKRGAKIVDWKDNEISVLVPKMKAGKNGRKVVVKVVTINGTSNGKVFKVLPASSKVK